MTAFGYALVLCLALNELAPPRANAAARVFATLDAFLSARVDLQISRDVLDAAGLNTNNTTLFIPTDEVRRPLRRRRRPCDQTVLPLAQAWRNAQQILSSNSLNLSSEPTARSLIEYHVHSGLVLLQNLKSGAHVISMINQQNVTIVRLPTVSPDLPRLTLIAPVLLCALRPTVQGAAGLVSAAYHAHRHAETQSEGDILCCNFINERSKQYNRVRHRLGE